MRTPSSCRLLALLPLLLLCSCNEPDRIVQSCLPAAGECPDQDAAADAFERLFESDACTELVSVESGPMRDEDGLCCYNIGVDDSDEEDCVDAHD